MSDTSFMDIMPWWAWALVTWAVILIVFLVITLVAPSDAWDISNKAPSQCDDCTQGAKQSKNLSDKGDVGVLTKSQCDGCTLAQLGMCLTKRRPDQCEAPKYDSFVVEPQNTWSNFGYLLAGLLILFTRPELLGKAVGINFCVMFFTSWLYHASLQNYPQSFDVAWIYVLLASMIIYGVETFYIRYFPSHSRFGDVAAWILFCAPMALGVLEGFMKATDHDLLESTTATITLIAVLFIVAAAIFLDRLLMLIPGIQWLYRHLDDQAFFGRDWLSVGVRFGFFALMGLFGALGSYLKLGDGCGKSLCSPHAGLQAHACWHFFGAVSLWWSYDFLAQAAFKPLETMIWIGPKPFETEGN